MNQSVIDNRIYNDSTLSQLGDQALYPCSTEYMVYKTNVSQYFLTEQALADYGIPAPIGRANKALQLFIEDVSNDLYSTMARLAPFNIQYNKMLVATSRSSHYNKFTVRQMFERALIYQAQYKVSNTDVRDINGIDIQNSANSIYHKQLRREFRHVSPKSMDILQSLGLFFNGTIPHANLINYSEIM